MIERVERLSLRPMTVTPTVTEADALRFWAKVDVGDEHACWPWLGARFHFGHGAFKVNGRPWGAHRIAWALTRGESPLALHVLHVCDNPPCCNPAHLYLGSLKDNGRDMAMRGRAATKLDALTVKRARLRFKAGESIKSIAATVPISETTLGAAIHGLTWKHLPGAVPIVHRRRRRAYRRRAG